MRHTFVLYKHSFGSNTQVHPHAIEIYIHKNLHKNCTFCILLVHVYQCLYVFFLNSLKFGHCFKWKLLLFLSLTPQMDKQNCF